MFLCGPRREQGLPQVMYDGQAGGL